MKSPLSRVFASIWRLNNMAWGLHVEGYKSIAKNDLALAKFQLGKAFKRQHAALKQRDWLANQLDTPPIQ